MAKTEDGQESTDDTVQEQIADCIERLEAFLEFTPSSQPIPITNHPVWETISSSYPVRAGLIQNCVVEDAELVSPADVGKKFGKLKFFELLDSLQDIRFDLLAKGSHFAGELENRIKSFGKATSRTLGASEGNREEKGEEKGSGF